MKSPMTSFVPLVCVTALVASLIGGDVFLRIDKHSRSEAWRDVVVVLDGQQITDPVDLTPRELARAQIIDRKPTLIGFGCDGAGGKAIVAQEEDEFPGLCKEIRAIDKAE
jgi:hypothetical protein